MGKNKEPQKEVKEPAKENKPVWHTAERILVTGLKLVRNPEHKELLKAVKFVTPEFELMYYPKTSVTTNEKLAGYDTELTASKPYQITEFIANSKMLNMLAENLQKGNQEIVCSFQESVFRGKTYFRLYKTQFEQMAYSKYDNEADFNRKVEEMKTAKEKAEAEEEYPM